MKTLICKLDSDDNIKVLNKIDDLELIKFQELIKKAKVFDREMEEIRLSDFLSENQREIEYDQIISKEYPYLSVHDLLHVYKDCFILPLIPL